MWAKCWGSLAGCSISTPSPHVIRRQHISLVVRFPAKETVLK